MPRRKKPKLSRVRKDFLVQDEQPIETNLKYWVIHALHWHALLFAVIAILVIGVTYFNKVDAAVEEDMEILVYPQ